MSDTSTPAAFWEARYAGTGRAWSGRVNAVLADIASDLEPARATDLGCGEGGDAVWLAQRGWTVTGVDLSPTAVERGRVAAEAAGVPTGRIRFVAADLAEWAPEEPAELVTASFLQSWPVVIPREEILRRAAGFVAPGGRLLVTAHAGAPSWSDGEHLHGYRFPTPEDDLRALALDPSRWIVELAEVRQRSVIGPEGEEGVVPDGVVLARRR